MRILIAGGGTGGHLTPALAVAEELRRSDPHGDVLLVGRRGGPEERIVTDHGFPFRPLTVRGVDGSRPWTLPVSGARMVSAYREAQVIIASFRPDVVVGTSGYVCVPVVVAARRNRIPFILLEQNALPGRTVRLFGRFAATVCTSFAITAKHLPGVSVIQTGNPIRMEVGRQEVQSRGDRYCSILVMGGSQGAHRINVAVTEMVAALLGAHPDVTVTHQSGRRDQLFVAAKRDALPTALQKRYVAAPFFDDIGARIAGCDLVVMRAGGSSLAECAALGRPMILIPYPHAHAHQVANARPYQEAGAARIVADDECSGARLRQEIGAVIDDPDRWKAMAQASLAMAKPDAAAAVVDTIGSLVS